MKNTVSQNLCPNYWQSFKEKSGFHTWSCQNLESCPLSQLGPCGDGNLFTTPMLRLGIRCCCCRCFWEEGCRTLNPPPLDTILAAPSCRGQRASFKRAAAGAACSPNNTKGNAKLLATRRAAVVEPGHLVAIAPHWHFPAQAFIADITTHTFEQQSLPPHNYYFQFQQSHTPRLPLCVCTQREFRTQFPEAGFQLKIHGTNGLRSSPCNEFLEPRPAMLVGQNCCFRNRISAEK